MVAVNYTTIRNNLKNYCDKATEENETIIVTRKNDKNVVLMSLTRYNEMIKAVKNAEYLRMVEESIAQFEKGKAVQHELIEVGEDD